MHKMEKMTSLPIIVGGMRLGNMDKGYMLEFIENSISKGANYFDYADIYGNGQCEKLFGEILNELNNLDSGFSREDIYIQSKCGICNGYYDSSKEHILESVDNILSRLNTDYLDALLIHRPDALVEPEEVAEAFDILEKSGKVRDFGVSNHNPYQIMLLKKYVEQPLIINQLQFSIPVSNMIASGLEVNMDTAGAMDKDGHILDYCRLNDITIQAWSPFQMPSWKGCFIDSPEYPELNNVLSRLSEKYSLTKTGVATAWILRHPGNIQVVSGTGNIARMNEIIAGSKIKLSRQEWYEIYLAAGHILP